MLRDGIFGKALGVVGQCWGALSVHPNKKLLDYSMVNQCPYSSQQTTRAFLWPYRFVAIPSHTFSISII
jgi:hypothetical protein